MDTYTNKIYARPDDNGAVVKLFSSVFEQPTDGDTFVEEGCEDYHAHVHLKYKIKDEHGRYNYRVADGAFQEIPEIAKPPVIIPPLKPSLEEQVKALSTAVLEMAGEIYG